MRRKAAARGLKRRLRKLASSLTHGKRSEDEAAAAIAPPELMVCG